MLYEINEKALKLESEGKKITKLNIGDPDLATPDLIIERAYEAMKKGKTKYSSAYGEKALREKLSTLHNVSPENVVLTPGAKWGIFSTMYLLLNQGGNVVIPTPCWTAYSLIAKTLGVETRFLKTDLQSNWRIDVDQLEELIDKETRLLIINNPNNPTSNIVDERVLDSIVQLATEKGIPVLSDEIYSNISFEKTKSILEYDGGHILVTGFSKTFMMTGWRIGYVVAQEKLVEKIAKLNQITFTNVPVFIQEAALKALELQDMLTKTVKEEYFRRRNLACELLSRAKMEFSYPDAPFYIFPKYSGLDSERFALDLLDKGVAVAPGTAFGDYREHMRISLTAPSPLLESALGKICEALG